MFWDVLQIEGKPVKLKYDKRRPLLEKITGLKSYKGKDFKKMYKWMIDNLQENSVIITPQIKCDFMKFFEYIAKDTDNTIFKDGVVSSCLFEGLVIKDPKGDLITSFYSTPDAGNMLKLRRKSTKYDF